MTRIAPALGLLLLATTASVAADGAAVFKTHCATCHGESGTSDTTAGKALKVPALKGDEKVGAMSEADVVTRIKENEKHKTVVAKLSADDLAAVATYVKGIAAAK